MAFTDTGAYNSAERDRAYLAPDPLPDSGLSTEQLSSKILGWAQAIVKDGRSYLRTQPAYPYIQDGLDLINGDWMKVSSGKISDVKTDSTVRNLKEIVAAQTNIRIIPAFKSEMVEFREQQTILNKTFMSWQTMTFADRQIRKAWQWAAAAGTGYLGVRYDPNYWYKGKGDIVLDAYGPLDVLPIGMGRQHDIQKAYAVAHRVETPIHEAWRLFPRMRDKIRASRETSNTRGSVVAQMVKYASAVLKKFGPGALQETENATWEMVDIYYIYIDDDTINDTGYPIPMGEEGTNWSYTVPYVGQEIPIGKGRTRKAERADCLLYPNRRLIKVSGFDPDLVLNPDPRYQASPYWDAKVPLVQMRADDWAWGFLGFPLTRLGMSLEKMNISLLRGMQDSCEVRLDPPRAFDRTTAASSLMSTLNTRIPGQVVGLDMSLAGPNQLRPLLDMSYYEFPSYIPALVGENEQRITHQMGVADAAALARARQLPSGDSVDKIMEQLGPLIKDQSRNMEQSIRAMGELWKSRFFQFYTAARRMQMIGPDGVAEEDWDLDPGTLVPASDMVLGMTEDEQAKGNYYYDAPRGDQKPSFSREYDSADGVPYFERARWHKDVFSFTVTPYSLHELNSITRKLFYLQLAVRGFPLDWWTQAELFDIRNFGPPPMVEDEDGDKHPAETIMERWTVQKEIETKMAIAQQTAVAEFQMKLQAQLQPQGGGAPGAGPGPPPSGAPPAVMGEPVHKGRPPSGQEAPTLEVKGGGERSTIRESRH